MPTKVKLEQGERYQGWISLEAHQAIGTNAQVADVFKQFGFTNCIVTGTGRQRIGLGTWSKPTEEVELPEQITHVSKAIKELA